MTQEWFPPKQIAEHLGFSVQAVYSWLEDRKIPADIAIRFNKKYWRIHLVKFMEFLQNGGLNADASKAA